MTVTFYVPDARLIDTFEGLDPVRDWECFTRGLQCHIVLPYLLLRNAGHDVRLSSSLPDDGICVFFADHKIDILKHGIPANVLLVGARADKHPSFIADIELVSNHDSANAVSALYFPHHPQPGLVARDSARGDRLERIGFKGRLVNLHPAFLSGEWESFLNRRGIVWAPDIAAGAGEVHQWADYREIDCTVAVRRDRRLKPGDLHRNKPATKLYNSWLAGVPALLGPEQAFRELRRSELDYFEVSDLASAMRAVDRLRESPELYSAVVKNGFQRAREFTSEAVVERWVEILFETLPAVAEARLRSPVRRVPGWLRYGWERLRFVFTIT